MLNSHKSPEAITTLERFDNLPRSTKYLAATALASLSTAVAEIANESSAFIAFNAIIAAGYAATAVRTFIQDNPKISPED